LTFLRIGLAFGDGRIVASSIRKADESRDGTLPVCLSDSSIPSFKISNSEALRDESACIFPIKILLSSYSGASKNFWMRSKQPRELAVPGMAASRASAGPVVNVIMDKEVKACVIFRPSEPVTWA